MSYVNNLSPTSAVRGYVSPLHKWHNRIPSLSHLRVIGSDVFVHVPKSNLSKLQPRSWRGKFVGYGSNCRFYRVYHPGNDVVFETMQVTFIESPAPARYITPTGALRQPIGPMITASTPVYGPERPPVATNDDIPTTFRELSTEIVVPNTVATTNTTTPNTMTTTNTSTSTPVATGTAVSHDATTYGGAHDEDFADHDNDFVTTSRLPVYEDAANSDESGIDSDSDDSVASGNSVASNYNNKTAKPSKIRVHTTKTVRPSVHTMGTRQSRPQAFLTTGSAPSTTGFSGLVMYDDIGMLDVQALLATAPTTSSADPATYKKAMSSPFSNEWYAAMVVVRKASCSAVSNRANYTITIHYRAALCTVPRSSKTPSLGSASQRLNL